MRKILFLVLSFSLAGFALAQEVEPLKFVVAPETPGPLEQVLIEAQGVGNFLGDAEITWSENGKAAVQGVGERRFSFTTGPLGTRTAIRVTVDSPTQGLFSRTFIFAPSLVNLVWEADTAVPPGFLGKALYSAGSPLKIVAFPVVYSGSSRIAASSLSYQWQRGGESVAESSGLGRSTFSFIGDQLQSAENVAVDIYYGASRVARGELTVSAAEPQLLFYERDPLRGVLYEQALPQAVSLAEREITLKAEPFYFSRAAQRNGALVYSWLLGDGEVTGPESAQGALTLRQSGEGRGEGVLSASLQNRNPDMFVQAASRALRLVFGEPGTLLDLFGL